MFCVEKRAMRVDLTQEQLDYIVMLLRMDLRRRERLAFLMGIEVSEDEGHETTSCILHDLEPSE